MKNYYEILGVPDNASQDEIKKIYRSLSKTYHPDVYVSDKSFAERKFQDINEAYDVLSNISKRKKFDESLKNKSKNQHFYKKSKSNYEDLKKNNSQNEDTSSDENADKDNEQKSYYQNNKKKYNSSKKNDQLIQFLKDNKISVLIFIIAIIFVINHGFSKIKKIKVINFFQSQTHSNQTQTNKSRPKSKVSSDCSLIEEMIIIDNAMKKKLGKSAC